MFNINVSVWSGDCGNETINLLTVVQKQKEISDAGSQYRCGRVGRVRQNFSLPTKFAYDFRMIEIAKKFNSNMQYINQMNFVGRNEESF